MKIEYNTFVRINSKESGAEYLGLFLKESENSWKITVCNLIADKSLPFHKRMEKLNEEAFYKNSFNIEIFEHKTDYKCGDKVFVKYHSRTSSAGKNLGKEVEILRTEDTYFISTDPECKGIYWHEVVPITPYYDII
jgi:hypothetical protein